MESKDRQVQKTKGCNGVDVLKSEDFVISISQTLSDQLVQINLKRHFLVKMTFGAAGFHPQLLN